MNPSSVTALSLLVVVAACRPQVGPPISQINGPAILAVKAVPAEVDDPAVAGQAPVAYEALAVDANGRVPAPNADITDSLLWAMCDQPKPPTENNSVSSACLDSLQIPGVPGTSLTTYSAPVASNACSLFGPSTPPASNGQPSIRPRDPDVTGGYYQPVRVELLVPEGSGRAGMSTADSLIAFHLQRVQCGLANAPGDVIQKYGKEYTLNNNPVLTSLTVQQPGLDGVDVPATPTAGAPIRVVPGQTISLTANWSADSVESYPALDLVTRQLLTHDESMRVSWYATGGTFEHDVVGRNEDESRTQPFATNTWKADAELVHMWLVLHDARGGTDFASFDFDGGP